MHAKPSQVRAYIAGELEPRDRRSIERHVHRCLACWEYVQAATPRTAPQWLQNSDYSQVPLGAETIFSASVPGVHHPEPERTSRLGPWIPAVMFLGVLAIVGTLVGLAWTLGAPSNAAAAQTDPTGAWSATATKLDARDLDQLRAAGWSCPVVEVAGFQLASATGTRENGSAEVKIVLKNNSKELALTESRELSGNLLATGLLKAPPEPVAKKQGTEVTDGALAELGKRLGAKAGATVDFGRGTATLNMDDVNYTVTSNLSKKDMESLLQRLVIGEHTHFSAFESTSDKIGERLMRGASRILVLDFS